MSSVQGPPGCVRLCSGNEGWRRSFSGERVSCSFPLLRCLHWTVVSRVPRVPRAPSISQRRCLCVIKPFALMSTVLKLPRSHPTTTQPVRFLAYFSLCLKRRDLFLEVSLANSVRHCQGTAASNRTPPHSPASLHHPGPRPLTEAGGEVILDSAIHIDGVW